MTFEEIVAYYKDLLIAQYWDKPKARATIDLFVTELLANNLVLDVTNGYNIDTAVGVQLDIIGKYVGVTRYFTGQFFTGYFAFVTYDEDFGAISAGKRGFSSYADMSKSGLWLKYSDIVSSTYTLTDDDYRIIIKMKIFLNNTNNSHKEIDDFIYNLFGTNNRITADNYTRITADGDIRIEAESPATASVAVSSSGNMIINYTASPEMTAFIQVAIEKEVLPKPIGVQLVF